jgi:hypothetical protein
LKPGFEGSMVCGDRAAIHPIPSSLNGPQSASVRRHERGVLTNLST